MRSIYYSGNYNFFYVALVADKNSRANYRLDDYNTYWVPTCYFDGGYRVHDGMTQSAVAFRVETSGQREVPELDLDISVTWLGNASVEVTVNITNNHFSNQTPDQPLLPAGPAGAITDEGCSFSTAAVDGDDDQLFYLWDWGGGVTSGWQGPHNSGDQVGADHSWAVPGDYDVRVMAKDGYDYESAWSEALTVIIRDNGDVNGDFSVNVGDAVFLINYVFKQGLPPILPACGDVNCDGTTNVGDAVFMINHIFKGGSSPGC